MIDDELDSEFVVICINSPTKQVSFPNALLSMSQANLNVTTVDNFSLFVSLLEDNITADRLKWNKVSPVYQIMYIFILG